MNITHESCEESSAKVTEQAEINIPIKVNQVSVRIKVHTGVLIWTTKSIQVECKSHCETLIY